MKLKKRDDLEWEPKAKTERETGEEEAHPLSSSSRLHRTRNRGPISERRWKCHWLVCICALRARVACLLGARVMRVLELNARMSDGTVAAHCIIRHDARSGKNCCLARFFCRILHGSQISPSQGKISRSLFLTIRGGMAWRLSPRKIKPCTDDIHEPLSRSGRFSAVLFNR